ncbi:MULTISPECIES: AIM24 family protein [unclassified Streptomyces]|uniref:AIM24 family protein n=1 Tax=unclassified Streptomyces TaxID=2593676 RepID=UPI002034605A|nr:AIM24 family protein [Streptomyces sp. RKAG290]MCM2416240.1 AIM24 family protein [Streptomyces sp. RKAG290]
MQRNLFDPENIIQPAQAPGLTQENPMAVRYAVKGDAYARQGTMVAWRGSLEFERHGQGVGNFLKRAVTGEGLALMNVTGEGEAWFASDAAHCFLVDVDENNGLTVNGKNVLCFDASLSYDITTVKGAGMAGGGLFNCTFTGTGRLALTSAGIPLVLPVSPDAPLFVDTDAVVAWSPQLSTSLHRSQGIGSMLKGGSGEAVQLKLEGQGLAVVNPGEPKPTQQTA